MSIEARQIQETLYSYAAILNFTPSPQGLRAKFGACSVQNAQLLRLTICTLLMVTLFNGLICYPRKPIFCKITKTVLNQTTGWVSHQLGGFHAFLPSSARIIVVIRVRRKRRWYN